MTLRSTWLLPPAMVSARVDSALRAAALAALFVASAPVDPEGLQRQLASVLHLVHADQLAHARRRPRVEPAELAQRDLQAERSGRLQPADERAHPVVQHRLRSGRREQIVEAAADVGVRRHRHPLVRQRGAGEPPAAVDRADHAVVGHEDVVDEDLVEQRVAGDLAQRADVDALGLHVDEEVRDALVVRGIRVRAGEADAPIRLARKGSPDLLPRKRPAAVDLRRLGTQRGEVGAGARLGEQLAPGDLADQRRDARSARAARRCRAP